MERIELFNDHFQNYKVYAKNLNRRAYGFEIKKDFFKMANEKVLTNSNPYLFCESEKVRYTEKQQELIEV